MASSDPSPPPPASAPAKARPAGRPPARARRRLAILVGAAGLVLAGGWSAAQAWASWQERAAGQALAEERFDDAQRDVERSLWVRDGWSSTHLLAARIDRLRGAYPEAERHLTRCEQIGGATDQLQLEWLLLRCQEGDVDALAPGLLAAVDKNHPESPAILEALAAVYMRQARYPEALRCLDRWVERQPDSVPAHDWRGWVSNQLDDRRQAVADYQRALELLPGLSSARLRLAQILIDSSRYGEAVPHLQRLRQERPADPEVLTALARCWMVLSRRDDARALLDSVIAAHPDDFDALFQRGQLELDDGRAAEAERWLRQALDQSPHDPQARYSLYLALQAQGDRDKEAAEELARSEQDRRTRDRLARLVRTELAAQPDNANLADEAGELFLQLGEDQRGLFWLHRALAIDPRHAATRRALLGYYERAGDTAQAEEQRRRLEGDGQ